jgi:hypothetical protein
MRACSTRAGASIILPAPSRFDAKPMMLPVTPRNTIATRAIRRAIVVAALAAVGGCATVAPAPEPLPAPAPTAPPVPANREPPPPNVNLSGFPLPYRQGYADGCASATGAERKDAARFASDPNYRTGWQDGVTLCRKK